MDGCELGNSVYAGGWCVDSQEVLAVIRCRIFCLSIFRPKNIKIKIYRAIILPVVLYGCETSSLALNVEGRLRVFENRILQGIFGPKRYEVTGEWRKLHNEELNDLYSPNIWIKIDQLDVTLFIISLFTAQHVSNVSTSIFRSLRLTVDLFHVLYCSGSMCVGVTVWFGWGGVVSLCRLKHLPTRETPQPPNTNNSRHQKQLPTTPLPNTI